MPVGAVEADLEAVAPQQAEPAVGALQRNALQRDGMVEQLQAGLVAQATTVHDRLFAGGLGVEPCGHGHAAEEDESQGAGHPASVVVPPSTDKAAPLKYRSRVCGVATAIRYNRRDSMGERQ